MNFQAASLKLNHKTSSNSQEAEAKKLKKLIEYDRISRRRLKSLVIEITRSLEEKVKQLLIENYSLKGAKKS